MVKTVDVKRFLTPIDGYKCDMEHPFKDKNMDVQMKHMDIVLRINRINKLCRKHYEVWENRDNPIMGINRDMFYLQEEIIYHVKRVIDDMISLLWVIRKFQETKQQIMNVEVDCIGDYIHGNIESIPCLKNYKDVLNTINEIANAYKHSYIQNLQLVLGRDEPCFCAKTHKRNNFRNNQDFYVVSQNYIMEELEKLFNTFDKELR